MQPPLIALQSVDSGQERLIVITRALAADASAAYVARLALSGARRGERVSVVLTREALVGLTRRQANARLGAMAGAGVRLLRLQRRAPVARAQAVGDPPAEWITEQELGAMLLRPGMHCQWC